MVISRCCKTFVNFMNDYYECLLCSMPCSTMDSSFVQMDEIKNDSRHENQTEGVFN